MTDETPDHVRTDFHVPYAEPKPVRAWEPHEKYQRALLIVGIAGAAGGVLLLLISFDVAQGAAATADVSRAAAAGAGMLVGWVLFCVGVLATLLFLHVRAIPPR